MKLSKIREYKKLVLGIFFVVSLLAIFIGFSNLIVISGTSEKIYVEMKAVPHTDVALILGARVLSDGRLSHMMQDRADAAIELYSGGKVDKILMSGDHGTKSYDEVNTVKNYLLERGVHAEDLFLDHAGFDTYDSLYRARDVFEVHSVIVVTQKFHLPRAVYIGNSLGMETYGYVADKREYQGILWNEFREIFSRSKAFADVFTGAKPKFLGDKIPVSGDSRLSWD